MAVGARTILCWLLARHTWRLEFNPGICFSLCLPTFHHILPPGSHVRVKLVSCSMMLFTFQRRYSGLIPRRCFVILELSSPPMILESVPVYRKTRLEFRHSALHHSSCCPGGYHPEVWNNKNTKPSRLTGRCTTRPPSGRVHFPHR